MRLRSNRCPESPGKDRHLGATDEKRAGKALLWKAAQLGSSRLLNLITSLVLGRLLTPVDFGIVAIASVAVTTMMTATETGMTNALVQATDREREHYDVAWTIGLIRGSLVCAVLCIAAPYIAELFGDARATSLVRMMAFLPLLNSINSPHMTDLMRELKFSRIALVAITAVSWKRPPPSPLRNRSAAPPSFWASSPVRSRRWC